MKLRKFLIVFFLILSNTTFLKAQIAQIPFEFRGKHMFIKVLSTKNDTLHYIFDTGTTGASIDSIAAERAGLNKENLGKVMVSGNGGSQFYPMAYNQTLKMSDLKIEGLNLTVVNYASLSAALGTHLDGLIGYEVLKKYVTQLDFDRHKIFFYDHIKSADTTGYTAIPFEFNKNILIPRFPISITLDNGETFTGRVMFDSGNAFPLLVSAPFSKYHGFNNKIKATGFAGGVGAAAETTDQTANINSMSFNDFNFEKMGIRLTVNDRAEPKDGYLGILGIEVIKHFNVILDYSNKKIYLKPNLHYHDSFPLEKTNVNLDKESSAFLEVNKKKRGVKTTASGLQYKLLKKGQGPIPTLDDKVSLHYSTSLFNGKKLWSTYDVQKPWVHHLDKAIAGVREAVLLLPAGSKATLYIPASLAFGNLGDGEDVPPGAALIYELEVLKAEK